MAKYLDPKADAGLSIVGEKSKIGMKSEDVKPAIEHIMECCFLI